jgi:hypothetical protein
MTSEADAKVFGILRQRGLLSPSIQKVMIGFMSQWGVDAFRAVVETHIVEESKIADILAQELKFPRLTRVRILNVPKETLAYIPYNLALELVALPFEISDTGRLHVVFADPSDPERIKKLENWTKKSIEPFVGERSEIIATIQRHYPLAMQLPSLVSFKTRVKDMET